MLIGKSFDVQDGFLKKIRVAQYQHGTTRVVLEVRPTSPITRSFLLPNPYRLIIDIHGRQPQSQTQIAKANAAPSASSQEATVTAVEKEKPYRSVEKANELAKAGASPPTIANSKKPTSLPDQLADNRATPPPGHAAGATSTTAKSAPRKTVVADDDDDDSSGPADVPATSKPRTGTATSEPSSSFADDGGPAPEALPAKTAARAKQSAITAAKGPDPLFSGPEDKSGPELKATTQPTTAPTAVAVAPRSKDTKKSAKGATTSASAAHEAAPTSSGDRSLTRALGLKIGRIVVDAGHGGHDTGTIGPDGLMEKDLVLDVALRLGRLLETRLGADVIYTRDDDTFIPLETRTAIANEHQADLFVSVHANSSSDPSARGVETYYLNFTSNPEALDVAARENAVSEKSIFELQDLVKITLKDKIDESRELATDVQQSLYAGLAPHQSTLRDRGVKKAPFVVLIGANMPSILAEISFVSNPTDEAKLQTPEYREKIAESLYKGIAKYAGGLSGVKVATKFNKEASQ